jgi:asparagine synthase (glutamine-hydrolysing)
MKGDGMREHFDCGAVGRVLAAHERGRRPLALWPVLNFALWHRQWIEQEAIDDLVLAAAS